jgi:hypothetical protein
MIVDACGLALQLLVDRGRDSQALNGLERYGKSRFEGLTGRGRRGRGWGNECLAEAGMAKPCRDQTMPRLARPGKGGFADG